MRQMPEPRRQLCDRYPWILQLASEPIEDWIFGCRTWSILRRHQIATWGELGTLSDEDLHAIPNIGAKTVQHIHATIVDQESSLRATIESSPSFLMRLQDQEGVDNSRRIELTATSAWATVVAGTRDLGAILDFYRMDSRAPPEVEQEIEDLLSLSLDGRHGREFLPLHDALSALLEGVPDVELLSRRKFSRSRPTFRELAEERGVTPEAVRRSVARSTEVIYTNLHSSPNRAVKWAIDYFSRECGAIISAEASLVQSWQARVGYAQFEFFRWLAGYRYDGGWLVYQRSAEATVWSAIDQVAGDEWLIRIDDLKEAISGMLSLDELHGLVNDYCPWRLIGDGWLVRWDGSLEAKAERVLALVGEPMTPSELIGLIGHGSEGSLKNKPRSLVRVDKQFRLALPEWEYEEYDGITNGIDQRIEQGGGVASMEAILEEFPRNFGVSEASVRMNLEFGPYVVHGDTVRHLADRGYTPRSVAGREYALEFEGSWAQRFVVEDRHLKGYSFGLDRDIAAHNGLEPDDSLRVPAIMDGVVVGEASLIWRVTNLQGTVDVGRLSRVLRDHGIGTTDEILILATRETCTLMRPDKLVREPRTTVNDDVKRILLGRR